MVSIFYFNNGATADSVQSLIKVLESLDENTFKYHCNNEKNDFYNWIKDGLMQEKTATLIKNIKTKKGTITKLKRSLRA
jgi:hypothetical protein